jgi:hypothetical protein
MDDGVVQDPSDAARREWVELVGDEADSHGALT